MGYRTSPSSSLTSSFACAGMLPTTVSHTMQSCMADFSWGYISFCERIGRFGLLCFHAVSSELKASVPEFLQYWWKIKIMLNAQTNGSFVFCTEDLCTFHPLTNASILTGSKQQCSTLPFSEHWWLICTSAHLSKLRSNWAFNHTFEKWASWRHVSP